MNIVRITNKIALIAVILLIYWVFIFVSCEVFGFKVFRENMTEIFYLSIFGLFAVMTAAVILNIMLNLTAIAEGRPAGKALSSRNIFKTAAAFIGSLAVIFALLYTGDLVSSRKKEAYLVAAASDLVKEQRHIIDRLADYSFSRQYIEEAARDIGILSKVEEKFPQIIVIAPDKIEGRDFLLRFSRYSELEKDEEPQKSGYILSTSSEERQYLYDVFAGKTSQRRFSASDGRYELYYPVQTSKGTVIIHLSQYNRYGKLGS
ncbi:MAG: hypothetical protein CSB24_05745 [Deltaproteobacteria bacterium]|nr:MAG: hypothetical protein CSB24_05745 [Deltaproteobacteria bacterium]